MEQRKKIVWLPGWFPNKTDTLSGDFNERHAHAVSAYADVTVVFAAKNPEINNSYEIDIGHNENISIYTGYYKGAKGPFRLLVSGVQYYLLLNRLYKMAAAQKGPFEFIHVCVALKQSLLALKLIFFNKKKIIISEHNSWFIQGDDSFAKKNFLFKWVIKKTFSKAAVHTVSKVLANALQSKKIATSQPAVIPNVVNTSFFFPVEKKNNSTTYNFVTVTGDTYIKNADAVLRCYAKARQLVADKTVLHVIGPNYNELAQLATDLKIDDAIIFYGAVTNKRVAEIMQQCNALIFFSRFETFGCVMAEALCCGLPVIASNLPVLHENLTHRLNAFFVESEDEQALTAALTAFINGKETYDSDKIAAAAFEKFNYHSVGKKIAALYQ